MKAWHFLREDGCLQYPPHTKVEVGQTLTADGTLELCVNGLHAAVRALDALSYAPGPIVCRVELGGEIIEGEDKVVARTRRVIAMADASTVLHEFACDTAEAALAKVKDPDPRSVAAIAAKRAWLRGECSDEALRAARDAARDAAWDAARDAARAARDAAWDAAWDAARAAAWDAAWDAARAAAWDAAWDAASAAARAAQDADLTDRLVKLLALEGK